MKSVTSLKNLFFEPFDDVGTVNRYFDKWSDDSGSKYYPLISLLLNDGDGVSARNCKDIILTIWKSKGNLSIRRGRKLHGIIETYFLKDEESASLAVEENVARGVKKTPHPSDKTALCEALALLVDSEDVESISKIITTSQSPQTSPPSYNHVAEEFGAFKRWCDEYVTGKYKFYKTEWKIRCAKLNLVGVVDAAFVSIENPDEVFIVDWKRCASIDLENPFGRMGKKAPFDVLPDCNFGHYSMQLNVYGRMIESEYSHLKVTRLAVVQIWKDKVGHFEVNRLF